MTHLIETAPFAIRHFRLPRARLPTLGIGATIAAVSTSITQAYCMAYVEPLKMHRRPPALHSDSDLEGRDPNW